MDPSDGSERAAITTKAEAVVSANSTDRACFEVSSMPCSKWPSSSFGVSVLSASSSPRETGSLLAGVLLMTCTKQGGCNPPDYAGAMYRGQPACTPRRRMDDRALLDWPTMLLLGIR